MLKKPFQASSKDEHQVKKFLILTDKHRIYSRLQSSNKNVTLGLTEAIEAGNILNVIR